MPAYFAISTVVLYLVKQLNKKQLDFSSIDDIVYALSEAHPGLGDGGNYYISRSPIFFSSSTSIPPFCFPLKGEHTSNPFLLPSSLLCLPFLNPSLSLFLPSPLFFRGVQWCNFEKFFGVKTHVAKF